MAQGSSQVSTEAGASERGAEAGGVPSPPRDSLLGRRLAYFILRLSLGVNFFIHWIVRQFGVSKDFVPATEKLFVGNLLPMWLVHDFLTILPHFEAVLGALLLLGLWTRWTVTAAGLLVTVLLFGTALRSDWTIVSHQMIYLLFVFILLAVEEYDYFSLDAVLARNRESRS